MPRWVTALPRLTHPTLDVFTTWILPPRNAQKTHVRYLELMGNLFLCEPCAQYHI